MAHVVRFGYTASMRKAFPVGMLAELGIGGAPAKSSRRRRSVKATVATERHRAEAAFAKLATSLQPAPDALDDDWF